MPAPKASDNQKAADSAGADQVQEKFNEANSKGYFGELPEQGKSFEDYTLKAVGPLNEK